MSYILTPPRDPTFCEYVSFIHFGDNLPLICHFLHDTSPFECDSYIFAYDTNFSQFAKYLIIDSNYISVLYSVQKLCIGPLTSHYLSLGNTMTTRMKRSK